MFNTNKKNKYYYNFMKIFKFLLLIKSVLSFNIKGVDLCVVGANSGLGRELIYQTAIEKNKKVLALSSSICDIKEPYRGGGFTENEMDTFIKSENIIYDNYWARIDILYKNIIFCTSAKPFEKDYSDRLTIKFLQDLPDYCKSISVISANGVGDSLEDSNIGIKLMNKYYLKDVYRAKERQEQVFKNYKKYVKKYIYRPQVGLSYGKTPLIKSLPRQKLANRILRNLGI